MTRLVVTADAEADTHEILSYLEREAGSSIAVEYGPPISVDTGASG